jgi:hypothetical protein
MRINDIGRAGPRQQLTYALAVIHAQRLNADACQYPREIGLLAAITPDLTNYRGTGPQRSTQLVQHTQLGAHRTVTAIHGD